MGIVYAARDTRLDRTVALKMIRPLQDALTTRIVESLSVALSARDERVLKRDVPATAKAYEFYLRANQIAYASKNWTVARDLYKQCLGEDPGYAPAWARLARGTWATDTVSTKRF